jgi:hypothetical protein
MPDGPKSSWQTTQEQNSRVFAQAEQLHGPLQVANSARPAVVPASAPQNDFSQVSRPVSEGWYAKRRDEAQAVSKSPEVAPQQPDSDPVPPPPPTNRTPIEATPANSTSQNSRVLMEWTRPSDQPFRGRDDLTGVAQNDKATLLR